MESEMIGKGIEKGNCYKSYKFYGALFLVFGLLVLCTGVSAFGNAMGWWNMQIPLWESIVSLVGLFMIVKGLKKLMH